MNKDWRYTAKLVSKFNPAFKDDKGHYRIDEWIGFFQIGKKFHDGELTFQSYLITEDAYIKAAIFFFKFHGCHKVVLSSLEKNDFSEYNYGDRDELMLSYNNISEGQVVIIEHLSNVVKLILRELIWVELFCEESNDIAVRFGYDFYMYFSSNQDLSDLFIKIEELGLYVD